MIVASTILLACIPLHSTLANWCIGEKNVLFIRGDYDDIPGEPVTKEVLSQIISLTNSQFEEMSFGQYQITSTIAGKTYRIGKSTDTKMPLEEKLVTLAESDYVVDDYDIVVFWVSNESYGQSHATSIRRPFGSLNNVRDERIRGTVVMNNGYDGHSLAHELLIHELGHTLGLNQALHRWLDV